MMGKEGITFINKAEHNDQEIKERDCYGSHGSSTIDAMDQETLRMACSATPDVATLSPHPMPCVKPETQDEHFSAPKQALKRTRSVPSTPRKQTGTASPFFTPSPAKRPRPSPGTVSCIIAPPLSSETFGLIQEELAKDPFRLLIAVIFLNRTRGSVAIPRFRQLMEHHPTPQDIADTDIKDIAKFLQPLGLHNQRASTIVSIAKLWVENPPVRGWRFRTPSYPSSAASKNIRADEVLGDDDPREGAFEIGHMLGLGVYAWDSWRIFCRDTLRGRADSWNGQGAPREFEPEWKRVVPKDKELRAFLRWMWLKEGWKWDPQTGEREVASEQLMRRGDAGGLRWDEDESSLV